MTPDKAQQLGNDLACLAASISEIAEEIKAMHDFDHDAGYDEPKPPSKLPTFGPVCPKRAFSDAIDRSHTTLSTLPPPMA